MRNPSALPLHAWASPAALALLLACGGREHPASAAPPAATPAILAFLPALGVGGSVNTQVTLTGSHFSGATQVAFNGIADPDFIVDSPTTIRAFVPLGASTGPITVATPEGIASSPAPFTVTFGAELIVRTAKNLATHENVVNLVQLAAANHVQTLVVAAKQDEDWEFDSGTVFYDSALAERAFPDFDALKDVIAEAHKVGLKVKAWVPQFHDQVAFRKDPSWAMKALVGGQVVTYTGSTDSDGNPVTDFFVNPCSPAVQAYERAIVAEIATKYAVDGIVLDWVRFDGWTMDMGPESLAAFHVAFPGEDPTALDFTHPDPVASPVLAHWQQWRTAQIGKHVQAIRAAINAVKPGLPLGAFVLPPEFLEDGQDAATFKDAIDFISPMCYLEDWSFDTTWVTETCLPQIRAAVGPKVEILPAVDLYLAAPPADPAAPFVTGADYTEINAGIRKDFPEVKALAYFLADSWTRAAAKRADAVRQF